MKGSNVDIKLEDLDTKSISRIIVYIGEIILCCAFVILQLVIHGTLVNVHILKPEVQSLKLIITIFSCEIAVSVGLICLYVNKRITLIAKVFEDAESKVTNNQIQNENN